MYTYESKYHGTLAKSKLSPDKINQIEVKINCGRKWLVDKNDLTALKRLERKMCGMSDCKCGCAYHLLIDTAKQFNY